MFFTVNLSLFMPCASTAANSFASFSVLNLEKLNLSVLSARASSSPKFVRTLLSACFDEHAEPAVYSACIMQGTKDDKTGNRYFYPDTNITRAETSAVFTRLLEYKADPAKFVQEKIAEYGIVLRPVEEIPQPLGKE